jgi:aspartyl-tRNA(Asn)/glutamyl-tRNA(Gln) amidotransferase subunit B
VNLTRIHLEEDAGKSIHDIDPYFTLVDLNRAGVPLIEIVSEPDIRSGDEAMAYLNEVRKLVRYLDICDGNMEEGSMRCDANVSVRLKGTTAYNPRSEVKNMNSMRNVKRAIEFEFMRQIDALEAGEPMVQETRGFDASERHYSFAAQQRTCTRLSLFSRARFATSGIYRNLYPIGKKRHA